MMKMFGWKNWAARGTACLIILALALLFAGAVRIQDGLKNKQAEKTDAIRRCRIAVSAWDSGVPEGSRQYWSELSARSPEMCLRALCGSLRPEKDAHE